MADAKLAPLVAAWRAAMSATWKAMSDSGDAEGLARWDAAQEALRAATLELGAHVDPVRWPGLLGHLREEQKRRGELRDAKTVLYRARVRDKAVQAITDKLIKEWDRGR
jgi:hypothetical protein